jgi:predicted GNAT family acetyltransferase
MARRGIRRRAGPASAALGWPAAAGTKLHIGAKCADEREQDELTEHIDIQHEPEQLRFVARIVVPPTDSESPAAPAAISGAASAEEVRPEAVLEYRLLNDRTLDYHHTFTPVALRGRGIAGKLATFALDYALDGSFSVEPTCPFVATFIAKNPKYQALLAR